MLPDKCYHNSQQAWLKLYDVDPGYWIRPRGLWFARGDRWTEYASTANPLHARLHSYTFELDMGAANVCELGNEWDYILFTVRFGRADKRVIDWHKVASHFDGIEIVNPSLIRRNEWSEPFDVASGCIWTASKLRIAGRDFVERRAIHPAKRTKLREGVNAAGSTL